MKAYLPGELKRATQPKVRNLNWTGLGCCSLILAALSATAQAQSGVTLVWDRSSDATVTGYYVYSGSKSAAYTSRLSAGNTTSNIVGNLVGGATYYFAVTAANAAGLESDPSNEVTYTVPLSNAPPTIALTSPANGASYTSPSVVSCAASVTSNAHTITKVQFYSGPNLLGEDAAPPYTLTWSNVIAGNYSVSARVIYDAGSTVSSSPVTITVGNFAAVASIWPSTALPGYADAGADSAVELGVKFRCDVAGNITGIRFYKAAANTGTHVGNLWTSTGTLLGSASFSSETASGWQQATFAAPVAIAANTVYVASYHTTVGHYSQDVNCLSAAGVDNPPLHALANGVSGGDGVYVYCSSSVFPNQTWSACNYWVDVMFQQTNAPTLSSVAVTPSSPTVSPGATLQFAATGTYSDGSSQNLTARVAWNSSAAAVATIGVGGLATAGSPGTATISASLAGVTGSSVLTVQAAATNLPAPWQVIGIGNAGLAGTANASNNLFTLAGAGNLSGTADNFLFAYQPLSADGEIRARMNSAQTSANGRAGVMIRETLTPGARYAFMGLQADGTFRWQRRGSTGGNTSATTSGAGTPPNAWVRLVRASNTLSGYQSVDGTNWTQVASRSITMATNIYLGLAVTSGSTNVLNTATFTNLIAVP